jgi:hypothetical protein
MVGFQSFRDDRCIDPGTEYRSQVKSSGRCSGFPLPDRVAGVSVREILCFRFFRQAEYALTNDSQHHDVEQQCRVRLKKCGDRFESGIVAFLHVEVGRF